MSVTGADVKKVKELINTFLSKMSVDLEAEVSADTSGIKVALNGKDSALVIGYHGETLADIAYLLGLIVKKQLGIEDRVRIDVAGYLDEKDKKIREMTERTVEKVKRSGFPEELQGLNAYERRIAHEVVSKEGLVSESIGFGKERKLVVKPKNSSE